MKRMLDMTQPEIDALMRMLGQATASVMPAGSAEGRACFVLVVFDEPRLAHYVTNAQLKTVVAALRGMANQIEAGAS